MKGLAVAGIGAAAVVVGVATYALVPAGRGVQADPADLQLVAVGKSVYASQCASCHGARLEGQPEWRTRRADGRLPAPPHDATGHTWHHPDGVLFDIIKNGVGAKLPTKYETDMPVFRSVLTDDEIQAVLSYIKSMWPDDVRQRQAAISGRVR
jgi:mono/diheme cytochrome c family protein